MRSNRLAAVTTHYVIDITNICNFLTRHSRVAEHLRKTSGIAQTRKTNEVAMLSPTRQE